jgi:hypothetical protein
MNKKSINVRILNKEFAMKLKKMEEEHEAQNSQSNQGKEDFNSKERKMSQMKEYASDKKDISGQLKVYERRWVIGGNI